MSLAATTPASVTGARPDFSSRIVTLAASMAAVCVIVPVLIFCARIIKSFPFLNDLFFPRVPIVAVLFFSAVGVAGYGRLKGFAERWLHDLVETASKQLAAWGEKERSTALYTTITVLSGLTLFLELVLIRWQGSLFPVFALYKNFTLLACFCGLGIGYALAHRSPLLLPMTLPLLALTIFLLISLRYASLGDIFFFSCHAASSISPKSVKRRCKRAFFIAPAKSLPALRPAIATSFPPVQRFVWSSIIPSADRVLPV